MKELSKKLPPLDETCECGRAKSGNRYLCYLCRAELQGEGDERIAKGDEKMGYGYRP